MPQTLLKCTRCRASYPLDMAALRCGECKSPLTVEYPLGGQARDGPQPPGWVGSPIPLPIRHPGSFVSLGEGNTPCVTLSALGEILGLAKLHAKLEFINPTGSFKDRGTAIMLSVAKELGVDEIVEDSSGNAGASIAAYAARSGIKAHIFVPASAPTAKIQQIRVYGAETHLVEGPREAASQAAEEFCSENSLVYASHNLSPYFIEGTKAFAYEVSAQFGPDLPQHMVMPVGNGSLFIGAWKGFQELQKAGRVATLPRLHLVQAEAVMPIVAACQEIDWAPGKGARTIAGGISVGDPPRKREVLHVLRSTQGTAVAVIDHAILRWQRLLAEREGVYCEPTSAAALAGLEALMETGAIQKGDTVLIPVTGFGLKDAPPM